jgi:hypothetical protein
MRNSSTQDFPRYPVFYFGNHFSDVGLPFEQGRAMTGRGTFRGDKCTDYETPAVCPMNDFRPARHHVCAILAVLHDEFYGYPEDEATVDRCRRALDVFERWITSERGRLAKRRSE